MAYNQVDDVTQELGVASISQTLLENVTQYHAQIGANVKRDHLQELEWRLLATAKDLFHHKKYEEALNTFTHCLAVTEKTRTSKDHAVRGAVIHNIASCLHNLGEMEAAQAYYEQAIAAFQKAETPMLEKAIYGDANKRRISFVKERLVDITWGRKPDVDKYLDENGRKRPVPEGRPPPVHAGEHHVDRYGAYMADRGDRTNGRYGGEYGGEYSGGEDSAEQQGPGWLAAADRSRADDDGYGGGGDGGGRAYGGEPRSRDTRDYSHGSRTGSQLELSPEDMQQERARKEWLQYYLQTGEWARAAELVVSADEREDLAYLRGREARELGSELRSAPRAADPAISSGSSGSRELDRGGTSAPRVDPAPPPPVDEEDLLL
eukprot:CAMPEP_0181200520 /NCGR_PEP_ID=MMETSP1096-20121128/17811_1 /TAXON_ID=156174 ORGANISM="Chrysochromulina ericina, Strain CCMP281" /NCGR_SAMPLE_ID=MMETSP1096 /ASSEMBLY_ACC=CAM_ASM_000453 /LENGTH=376 /DNA_ID=CAMNT_0023290889 /DNA_START=55 /DNA_END=1185 /DNA_ORIENTATION=+